MKIDVEEHKGLIREVVNRLFGGIANAHKIAKTRGMDVEDLFQIGYMAMWKAGDRYDSAKGEWSTYACKYIKGYILKEINNSFPFKMPSNMTLEDKIKYSKVESLYTECGGETEGLYLIDNIPASGESFTDEFLTMQDFEMKVNELLTEREREVFLLWVYQDLTHNEIALKIGCTRMNVTTLINKAKRKLSQEVS